MSPSFIKDGWWRRGLWKNCVPGCKRKEGREKDWRWRRRNSRWKKYFCAWWAGHGPLSRNSPGSRSGASGLRGALDDFAPFALRMQAPQCGKKSPVRPDRHRAQRIIEAGAAVTADLITMPADRENPA